MSSDKDTPAKQSAEETRKRRLAEQLRANLRRRKAQARDIKDENNPELAILAQAGNAI